MKKMNIFDLIRHKFQVNNFELVPSFANHFAPDKKHEL